MAVGFSSTPSSASPDPHSNRKDPQGPKDNPRNFEDLLKNDRAAVQTELDNFMGGPKWKDMEAKDRKAALRKKIADKLEQRKEGRRNVISAIRTYPERVDVDNEIDYFLQRFRSRIEEPTTQDDREPASALKGGRGIKKEYKEDDDTEESEGSTNDEEAEASGDQDADDGDEPDGPFSFKVVSRGLVIQTNVEVKGFTIKARTNSSAAANSRPVNGKVAASGIAKQQDWKRTMRSWNWVNGKMVIWPAIDAILQVNELS